MEMVTKSSIGNKLINQQWDLSLEATSKELDHIPMVDLSEDCYLIYKLIYFFLDRNLWLIDGYDT